jgi:hypothetical protein
MFHWQKKVQRLDIPAQRVLLLQKSLCNVQLALPGLFSQLASAYLCVFTAEKGIRVVAVFHLHESRQLAFYFYDGEVRQQDRNRVLTEGINFIETMGFMLVDLDFPQIDLAERTALWESLPLRQGDPGLASTPPVEPIPEALPAESPPGDDPEKIPAPTRSVQEVSPVALEEPEAVLPSRQKAGEPPAENQAKVSPVTPRRTVKPVPVPSPSIAPAVAKNQQTIPLSVVTGDAGEKSTPGGRDALRLKIPDRLGRFLASW